MGELWREGQTINTGELWREEQTINTFTTIVDLSPSNFSIALFQL